MLFKKVFDENRVVMKKGLKEMSKPRNEERD